MSESNKDKNKMLSGESIGSKAPTVKPLNFTSFESSPTQLAIHKLNGKIYLEWAQSMKLVINGKGLLGHLTGEYSEPSEDDRKQAM